MSDGSASEGRLRIGEISVRLGIPVPTVGRMFADGALRIIRERGWRHAYESQVTYVAGQMAAHRAGSVEDFAREWLAAHPEPQHAGAVA